MTDKKREYLFIVLLILILYFTLSSLLFRQNIIFTLIAYIFGILTPIMFTYIKKL